MSFEAPKNSEQTDPKHTESQHAESFSSAPQLKDVSDFYRKVFGKMIESYDRDNTLSTEKWKEGVQSAQDESEKIQQNLRAGSLESVEYVLERSAAEIEWNKYMRDESMRNGNGKEVADANMETTGEYRIVRNKLLEVIAQPHLAENVSDKDVVKILLNPSFIEQSADTYALRKEFIQGKPEAIENIFSFLSQRIVDINEGKLDGKGTLPYYRSVRNYLAKRILQ